MQTFLLKKTTSSVIIKTPIKKEDFTMLRIAVCDDSELFRDEVSRLLDTWQNNDITISKEAFKDGPSLVAAHTSSPFDIILLDIVMSETTGIEAASSIRKNDKCVKIIFLTSSPEFALDSYSVKANGYLLKPIDKKLFLALLDEICEEISAMPKYIYIKNLHYVHKIQINCINYIEAQGKHVKISLANGDELSSDQPFYYFKTTLLTEDGFFSCHRSYIVNISHIYTYTSKEIILNSGARIPISRNCHKEFETVYFETAFGKVDEIL